MLKVPKVIKIQKIIILEFIETKQKICDYTIEDYNPKIYWKFETKQKINKNMWLLNRDQPSLH